MHPYIARKFFQWQERLLDRPTFRIFAELEQSQYFSASEMAELRRQRLTRVVQSAYEHTPYWRKLMDEQGIAPQAIRSLEEVRRFPLLDKAIIRRQREEMVWRGGGQRVHLVRTSGSTNAALEFYTCAEREAHISAARMRGHGGIGVPRGVKEMYFWGSPIELKKQDYLKRFRDFLVNDGLTNGFELTPELAARYVSAWRRWRPRCIFGYPSSLILLVRMAEKQGLDLKPLAAGGLRAICTTSEMLVDVDRQLISQAFGAPVFDSYGIREAGLIGHECAQGCMHTVDEQVLLETIDPDTREPSEGTGELVVTNLINQVMPIIRYRTGDIVTLGTQPCRCGRNLQNIRVSGGRATDFVVTSAGKWVAGYAFIYICRSIPGIVKFQVLQDVPGTIRVLLVTDGNFPADGAAQMKDAVQKRLGGQDNIVIEPVNEINPLPSGKYRPVISKVAEELRRQNHQPAGEAPRS